MHSDVDGQEIVANPVGMGACFQAWFPASGLLVTSAFQMKAGLSTRRFAMQNVGRPQVTKKAALTSDACQVLGPAAGSRELTIGSPPTQSVTEGHDMEMMAWYSKVPARCDQDPLAAGCWETNMLPASSLARHNLVDGQARSLNSFGNVPHPVLPQSVENV